MQLGQKYISPTADIVQYLHFEAGVVKIQKGIENQINASEKHFEEADQFLWYHQLSRHLFE